MLPSINTQQGLILTNNRVLILHTAISISSHHIRDGRACREGSSIGCQEGPMCAYRVCSDSNLTGLCILHKPCPTAALNTGQSSIKLLLHLIETAIGLVNCFTERSGWWLSSTRLGWRQILPEERVVEVTSAMKVDQWLEGDLGCNVIFGICLGIPFGGLVV
jgi:hypothetical protein